MSEQSGFTLPEDLDGALQTVFPHHQPDPAFVNRLGQQLSDQVEQFTTHPRNVLIPVSPLAWGAIGLIFVFFLIWGIKSLIPRVQPSIGTKPSPSPIASPSPAMEPTQAEGGINLPTLMGEAVPWPEAAITSANAAQITELARWGQGMILGIAWSPDAKTFAIGSDTGIHLYDVTTFEEIKTIANGSSVGIPAFSPDGTKLAGGVKESLVKIWDVASGSELQTLTGYKSFISNVAFLPGGDILVTQAYEEPIKLWDVASGQELRTLAGSDIEYSALSPDGTLMATTSAANTISLWDIASGVELRTLAGHTDYVLGIAFSPDGKELASASGDKTIKLWDVTEGIELTSITVDTGPVAMIYYSPGGSILASLDFSGRLQLWDTANGQEIPTHFEDQQVWSMAFSPDGQTILVSVNSDNTIKLLDVTNGKELRKSDWQSNVGSSVAVSPDGQLVASGSYFGPITLYNAVDGQVIRTLIGHTGEVTKLDFSPDGDMLASASWDMVKLWDLVNDKEMLTLAGLSNEGYASGVPSVAFSPDGKILAYGAVGGQVKLWDITDNKLLFTLGGQPDGEYGDEVNGVTFSPDGKILASLYSSYIWSITLWDVASGEELRTLTIKPFSNSITGGASILAFSPDGKYLASGIGNAVITLWDVASGSELRTLLHDSHVFRAAYSRDGDVLASATTGQNVDIITLWDAPSGQKLSALAMQATSLAFSPDGKVLVSGSWDGTVRLWGMAPANAIQQETITKLPVEDISTSQEPSTPATLQPYEGEKIPVPMLLSGEGLESWWWSTDGSYFPYSQQGPIGEPGPDQATKTLYFLDGRTGEICPSIQETVTFTQTEWGLTPVGSSMFDRTTWMDDNHLMYISPEGELLALTPCSDSIDNLSASLPDTITSLSYGYSQDSQILLKGEQAYWLFNPSTRQSLKLDLPAPQEDKEISFVKSAWEPKLISGRLEDRQGELWIVVERIDTETGSASMILETQASAEIQNTGPLRAGIERSSKDKLLVYDTITGARLYDLSSQPVQFTNLFPDLFGIEDPGIGQVSVWGTMSGTGEQDFHLILATGMAADGRYYIYHPESGKVDQYPLDPPLLVVSPNGEGGTVPSFVDIPQSNIFRVILVDSGMEPYDLVAKGQPPGQISWSFATIMPGAQKVMFSSGQGISLVDLKSGETLSFWSLENQVEYQDFYSMLSPDGKTVVGFASHKVDQPGVGSQIQDIYWLRLEP